jgi:hypothetical protein
VIRFFSRLPGGQRRKGKGEADVRLAEELPHVPPQAKMGDLDSPYYQ